MSDEITPELFTKLVTLAYFAFDPTEAEYLRSELNKQLRSIHQLEMVMLDENVPLASRGVTYTSATQPPLRPDVWQPFENPGEILEQAPDVQDGFFVAPDIPHTELD